MSNGKLLSKSVVMVLAFLAIAGAPLGRAHAGGTTSLNGAAPRPFYVVAHNPNSLHDVEVSLLAGANALEPDITTADCGGTEVLVDHDPVVFNGADCDDTHFVDWLDGVHTLAISNPQLALVVFDIKTDAATSAHGAEILELVRTHLNFGPVNLNVIFSVASRDDGAVFDQILSLLGEREGVQVDQEDDAADIVNFFFDRGYSGNIGYGDGTTFQGPDLPRAHDKAAFLRATVGFPKAVTYVYTLNHDDTMHSFINGGVDGIIPDTFGAPSSVDPSYITQLLGVVRQHPEIRLATRDDNPFKPALESYGVRVTTDDDLFSGTDADITFTLHGCRGSATITVDTGQILLLYDSGRMRDGQTDWTTIPSLNLGRLSSITIFNDGSGDAPGWNLVDVAVGSARYLGPDFGNAVEYQAHFDDSIDGGDTVDIPLTPNFAEPPPTIQCPAPIAVPNAPGQCGAPVSYSPAVSGMCDDVTAVSAPPSGSLFPVGTTTVSAFAQSAAGPRSDPCTFTVSVQDVENPVLSCPAPIVTAATGPQGVAVSFAPVASDNCSIASLVSSPTSGSIFPIGDTTVNVAAADPSGNPAACSFNVHVKGPAEQASDLAAEVAALAIKPGLENALVVKLEAALASIQRNETAAACGQLQAFINLVAAQADKAIDPTSATVLIQAAAQIQAVLAC